MVDTGHQNPTVSPLVEPLDGDPERMLATVHWRGDAERATVLGGLGGWRVEANLMERDGALWRRSYAVARDLRTTYFVLPGPDLPMPTEGRVQIEQYRPYMREVNGFNVVYWKQKDMVYLMVSGLDREGCQKLYLKVRKEL